MSQHILKVVLFTLTIPSLYVASASISDLGSGDIGYEGGFKIIWIIIALMIGSILLSRGWFNLSNRDGLKSDIKGFTLMIIGAFFMSLPCLMDVESGAPYHTTDEVIKISEFPNDF